MTTDDRLSAQDASFLANANTGTPLNVAGLIKLAGSDRALTLDRLRTVVGERLETIPRLRQRVVRTDTDARWDDAPDFDVADHVDQLPVPADDPALVDTVAKLHATALDPSRALWQLSLVPGGRSGAPAILFRASHALVDGMSSMQVMRALFDPTGSRQTGARVGPDPDARTDADDDAFDVMRDLWASMRPRDRRQLAPQEYERALALLDGWISMLERGWHGGPRFASESPVRTRIALTELDSAGLRRVRRRTDSRFDVVGLTVCAAAVGRLLAARGEPTDTRLRTLVPVVGAGGGRRTDLGNRASFLLVTIRVGPMDPIDRLRDVAAEVGDAIAAGQHRAAAMSMRALETAPAASTAAISSFTAQGHFVDLVVSCVPGARRALTFDGIPHDVTFPILPITSQMRVAIGWGDIAGSLGVAVTADEHVLPEVDFLTDAIVRSSTELITSATTA